MAFVRQLAQAIKTALSESPREALVSREAHLQVSLQESGLNYHLSETEDAHLPESAPP